MAQVFQTELGGRKLSVEIGRFAGQANAAGMVRYGDTAILVTATMSDPREGIDFFPLLVDYEERMYAIGRIPGGWGRREGRPPEGAILAARMTDRAIRPLFPDGFRNDIQVVAEIMSVDRDSPPDVTAMIGASIALTVSDIPFEGPIGGVKVGYVNGEYVINPTSEQAAESDLELVVAGTKDAVMMVEAGANELTEDQVLEGIMFGHEAIQKICAWIEDIRRKVGKEKVEVTLVAPTPAVDEWVRTNATERIGQAVKSTVKAERDEAIGSLKDELHSAFEAEFGEERASELRKDFGVCFDKIMKEQVRRMIVEDHLRVDGRKLDEIRKISVDVGILPRAHGTGLFQRGQTQVLTVCTLGLKSDQQILDDLRDEDRKRYIHHYNFPAYSVGETRPMRSPGRREIGHGALAERALLPMIPSMEEFPYTLRLVSEVLESNGSTSQASVCGSTLALMDAGVPIKKPVAGIAMGLVKHGDGFAVLTDIQGIEDALGDMDFKVAGTSEGITAIQMDIKVRGVSREVLKQALAQAREGRLFILGKMLDVIGEPRDNMSKWAPRIVTLQIPVDKIRDVIGPGGKMIRSIIEETGVEIDIEDDGRCFIASNDESAADKAVARINNLIKDVEVGEVYNGKVKRIMNFGAFVEILPGKEGLVHISKLAHERVGKVEDVLNVGDQVEVKVTEIDHLGRINLSRKALLPKPEGMSDDDEGNQNNGRGHQGRSDRGGRGDRGDRGGRNRR